ncbi:hypothetical protein [Nocardioides sambongensis]|uniref:hypothetical protein n=1 Tax=Nocardioides sambongensis TaxID=2589074 RepID=UPI001127F89D|nr:hypothetical protein [Nocardioides sambongensis]
MSPETADLPAAVRLSWWGTGWLRAEVSEGVLAAAVAGAEVRHLVVGAPNDDPSVGSLTTFLEAERAAGGESVAAAFPGAGDPVGLRGPRTLTAAAIEAGQAVVLPALGKGLVPVQVGPVVEWHEYDAHRPLPPDLGEADRTLRGALLAAADGLAALDVASWSPEVADDLIDLRAGSVVPGVSWVPERSRVLLARALHLRDVVDLALRDDGGALGVTEAARRRDLLEPLGAAVRRALTACCSPDGWPPVAR